MPSLVSEVHAETQSSQSNAKKIGVLDLGLMRYPDALERQRELVELRKSD